MQGVDLYEGIPLEKKIEKALNNEETLDTGDSGFYTALDEGVRPETDIRTDKWDVAVEFMEKANNHLKTTEELAVEQKRQEDTVKLEREETVVTTGEGSTKADKN